MKKIFAFVGSSRGDKSNTFQAVKMLVEYLINLDGEIQAEIFTADKLEINFCRACLACSKNGKCLFDDQDDMGLLKEKMRAADLVIFASPNYVRNVSGQMKTFLDRLYSWYHTLELSGKAGLAVMASAGPVTGICEADEGAKYLAGVQIGLGIKALGYKIFGSGLPGQFWEPEKVKAMIEELSEIALPYISGGKPVESDERLETVFREVKERVATIPYMAGEKAQMEAKGFMDCTTFAQVLEKVKGE